MSVISHWLNSSLVVWRETTVPDGSGGFTVSYVSQGASPCKIDQSSATERLTAQQMGADHTHNVYFEPDADVERNDRLAPSGVDPNAVLGYYHVRSTHTPSTPRYLKAQCVRVE